MIVIPFKAKIRGLQPHANPQAGSLICVFLLHVIYGSQGNPTDNGRKNQTLRNPNCITDNDLPLPPNIGRSPAGDWLGGIRLSAGFCRPVHTFTRTPRSDPLSDSKLGACPSKRPKGGTSDPAALLIERERSNEDFFA